MIRCFDTKGLAGKTPLEEARADMLVDNIEEAKLLIYPIYFAKGENEKVHCIMVLIVAD